MARFTAQMCIPYVSWPLGLNQQHGHLFSTSWTNFPLISVTLLVSCCPNFSFASGTHSMTLFSSHVSSSDPSSELPCSCPSAQDRLCSCNAAPSWLKIGVYFSSMLHIHLNEAASSWTLEWELWILTAAIKHWPGNKALCPACHSLAKSNHLVLPIQ